MPIHLIIYKLVSDVKQTMVSSLVCIWRNLVN